MAEPKEPRPVEPDDVFRMKFLQGARVSPDGKRLAYTLLQTDLAKEQDTAAIWLMDLATGEARQLTSGLYRDGIPEWSPGGKTLAFISARNGPPQVWLMPVDGGEPRALTSQKQGVGGGPAWSPDGKWIAFTSGPETPRDPTKPYRVTRTIYRYNSVGYIDDAVQDLYIIAAEGGDPRKLVADGLVNSAPVWSPDGREILITSAFDPKSPAPLPTLRIANLNGEVRPLLGGWGFSMGGRWTHDGQSVVFIGEKPVGFASPWKLWVVGRTGGEPECRTPGADFSVGGGLQSDMPAYSLMMGAGLFLLPDDTAVFTRVQEGGRLSVYRFAMRGAPSWERVLGGERALVPLGLAADHMVYAASDPLLPGDLYVARLDGTGEHRLTGINEEVLTGLRQPLVERVQFTGADGWPIEGWIMKPPVGEAPYPTVLYVHGGPQGAFGYIYSFDFQMLAGAGYAVLYINPRGSTGYGEAFSRAVISDMGGKDYQDLMAGVDCAIVSGLVDKDRMAVAGLSYGGFMSSWIVGQTDRFKAAVPENPVTNWWTIYGVCDSGAWLTNFELGGAPHEKPDLYARRAPITHAHKCKTPTLLVQGELDYRCPAEESEQFYATLKANGCTVEMLRLPGSPHEGSIVGPVPIRKAQNEALLGWMNRYVLGKA